MEQPADMETLRDLATHQRKTAEYLQMLAGKFLTYEQQQREYNQAQSRRLDQQIAALVQAAQTMAGSGQRLVSETVKGVEAGTRNAIAEATQSQLHTLQEAAKRFAAGVHDAGAAIDRQRSSLESVRHGLLWKAERAAGRGRIAVRAGRRRVAVVCCRQGPAGAATGRSGADAGADGDRHQPGRRPAVRRQAVREHRPPRQARGGRQNLLRGRRAG